LRVLYLEVPIIEVVLSSCPLVGGVVGKRLPIVPGRYRSPADTPTVVALT
jgi:hypothetical protein